MDRWKSYLCHPKNRDRLLLLHLGELVVEGGLDPVRRGNAPKAAQPGNYSGIESNFGWDKWRWGKHMWERRGLVSICHPGTSSYSREYKNRFESLMLTRCENASITAGQRRNNLNIYTYIRVLNPTCLMILMYAIWPMSCARSYSCFTFMQVLFMRLDIHG